MVRDGTVVVVQSPVVNQKSELSNSRGKWLGVIDRIPRDRCLLGTISPVSGLILAYCTKNSKKNGSGRGIRYWSRDCNQKRFWSKFYHMIVSAIALDIEVHLIIRSKNHYFSAVLCYYIQIIWLHDITRKNPNRILCEEESSLCYISHQFHRRSWPENRPKLSIAMRLSLFYRSNPATSCSYHPICKTLSALRMWISCMITPPHMEIFNDNSVFPTGAGVHWSLRLYVHERSHSIGGPVRPSSPVSGKTTRPQSSLGGENAQHCGMHIFVHRRRPMPRLFIISLYGQKTNEEFPCRLLSSTFLEGLKTLYDIIIIFDRL